MKNREMLYTGAEHFKRAGIEEYVQDEWLLFSWVKHVDRTWYYLHMEEEAAETDREAYFSLIGKRCLRIPLQYITGSQAFMGLDFAVTPAVLIPRQDTEILVEACLKRLKAGSRVLDMCTGSGCILISLLYYGEKCTGTGADISADALSVARKNAQRNGVTAEFTESNLFEKIQGSFDMIVSNPPYIATEEIEGLMPEVRDYEPRLALDGTADGLYFYREIVRQSGSCLEEDGWLCLEIGCDQAEAVCSLMELEGFRETEVIQDLSGLDRVVVGKNRRK